MIIFPKLGAACFAVKRFFHTLNTDVLRMVYFAHFHSVIKYEIIIWGNSTYICHVFTSQKRIIRIMSGVGAKSACRNLFKKLDILPVTCQYIFSSMMSVLDNQKNFQTNLSVHGMDTRNNNQLYLPIVNRSRLQSGVSYCAMKIFNSFPNNIKNLRNDGVKFKPQLHKYLITHSLYSLTESFGHNTNVAHN
jgi:hypothetical protein